MQHFTGGTQLNRIYIFERPDVQCYVLFAQLAVLERAEW